MPKRMTIPGAQAAVTFHGGALYLFSAKDRNDIIRAAAIDAGKTWQANFLPLRFSKYVVRYPFNYGNRGAAWIAAKVHRSKNPEIIKRWKAFCNYNFFGWDPFTQANRIPPQLYRRWLTDHPNEYRTKNQGRDIQLQESVRAYSDIKKWAKKLTLQFCKMLDTQGLIIPLVDSGDLRGGAFGGQVTATSTTFSFSLKVSVPFPGPRNPIVPRIIQTVPPWESERVGTQMSETIASIIAGSSETFTRSPGGGVNRRPSLSGAQSRIPDTAYGRSVD